eukprot:SAG11_NODE_6483_length_1304_cov_16.550207_1_plen_56_part_10
MPTEVSHNIHLHLLVSLALLEPTLGRGPDRRICFFFSVVFGPVLIGYCPGTRSLLN